MVCVILSAVVRCRCRHLHASASVFTRVCACLSVRLRLSEKEIENEKGKRVIRFTPSQLIMSDFFSLFDLHRVNEHVGANTCSVCLC